LSEAGISASIAFLAWKKPPYRTLFSFRIEESRTDSSIWQPGSPFFEIILPITKADLLFIYINLFHFAQSQASPRNCKTQQTVHLGGIA